jgi:hypothetical protein
MRANAKTKLLGGLLIAAITLIGSASSADTGVYGNLNRSRDALLDQRAHLQQAADGISQKIAELQRQLDSVNAYLRDTDNAVRDIDNALKRY